ncbi:MAG: hypothetical protein ACPF83_04640 [Flavobacteriales bacterium]
MKSRLLALALVCLTTVAFGQDYNRAIGFRGGFFSGITYKQFVDENMAIEGILHSRYAGWQITGLAEWHGAAWDVPGLNWYYGAGGHVGIFTYSENSPYFDAEATGTKVGVGVDGVLGIEYNIKTIPINVSLDWKPALNLVGYTGFAADGGAFSVRYTF